MTMLNRIRHSLVVNCQVQPNETLLVGVSGGPDSLFLLDVLWRLECPLLVAHLDHSLRPESSDEAETVRQFARERDLEFVLERVDVEAFAREQRLSLEEAARLARYRFLFQQADACGAEAVAVGHTSDDQVETVLMHLFRGAGLGGLAGMPYRSLPNPWSQTKPLLRPLLDVWREEIMAYLQERGLQPVYDPSNLDLRFYRNRLRHEVIPYLEGIHPGLRRKLWRTSQVLHQDYKFLEGQVESAWESCFLDRGAGYLAFDLQKLADQPLSLRRYLLRKAVQTLSPGIRDVDFETIARATSFLEQPPKSKQIDLLAGLRMFLEGDRLWMSDWEADLPISAWPQLEPGAVLHLEAPGTLTLMEGWRINARLESFSSSLYQQARSNADPYQVWLDRQTLQLPLTVRSRGAGDRFQPLGMDGRSVKLAEFFIDHKLPRRAREGWPLVLSGAQIAWLPGYRPAHPFRLQEGSEKVVHLSLEKHL